MFVAADAAACDGFATDAADAVADHGADGVAADVADASAVDAADAARAAHVPGVGVAAEDVGAGVADVHCCW